MRQNNDAAQNAVIRVRLRQLREERNLYQKEVAAAVGLSRNSITKYEAGERIPSRAALEKLADFYGVSADYLLGRTNDRRRTDSSQAAGWPNLSPDRRERAEQIVRMPGIEGRLSHDITNAEFDVLWATLQAAIQAGLAIVEANKKAAEGGRQD